MAKFTTDSGVAPRGIRSNSAVQEMSLGTKVVTPDGRAFRYVQAGAAALVPGKLQDGPANNTDNANIAVVLGTAGATAITVTLGSTAATINEFAEGVIVINDEDGQGYTYSIKSHPAADAAADLVLTLDSDEPIVTALTTSSQATLVPNQYKDVIIHAASETGVPVGVAVTAITAEYFGFIQTRGTVACLHDATPAEIGEGCDASTTTDGCVAESVAPLLQVGVACVQGVSTEYNPIFLTIDG